MEAQQIRQEPKYQKWLIVVLSALMVCLVLGFCNSAKSLYVQPVTQALGISRSMYSITDSCRFASTAIINLFFGTLVVRFGPRKLIAAGFVCAISALLLFSVAESVWVFYVGGVLLGLGIAWTTTTMVGYVVNIWCKERKGTIMGAVLASSGLGAVIGTQTLSPIINSPEGPFAYRNAFRLAAMVLIVVGVIVVTFFRNYPAGHVQTKVEGKKATQGEDEAYAQLLRRPEFWAALACVFAGGLTLQGIQGVAVPHLRDVGMDASFGATVLSCQSIMLVVTKFSTGWFFDKKGLRFTSTMCMAAGVISSLILIPVTASFSGRVLALVFSVVSAAALPIETVMLPVYAQGLFGQKTYNKALGIFVSAKEVGYAIGGPLMNLCYDLTGDYRIAFFGASVMMAAALVTMLWIIKRTEKMEK